MRAAAVETLPARAVAATGAALQAPRRRGLTLARIVLVLVLATAVMELFVRFFLVGPSINLPHRTLGFIGQPHAAYRFALEGRSHLVTNALGMNDIDQPVGTHGTLVLGDSYVEAYQVPPSANLVSLFRARHPDQPITNAGRSAMHPLLYKLMADYVQPRFHADRIVLVLNASDLREMREARFKVERDASGRIAAITDRDPPPKTAAVRLSRHIARSSAIGNYLLRKYSETLGPRFRQAIQLVGYHSRGEGVSPGSTQPSMDEVMDFLIRELQDMAPLRIMYMPYLVYHSGGRVSQDARSIETGAFFAHAAARTGVPFVDVGAPLQEAFRATGQPPCGFANSLPNQGHPNELGHRVMEEALETLVADRVSAAHP